MSESAPRPTDTGIGGSARGFPTTHWSMVLQLADRSDDSWRDRMDLLVQTYWKPVFRHIRYRRSLGVEDAKDLTQDFFVHMLEGGMLQKPAPERSKFRTFVKACLENFLRGVHRDAHRQKRGGDAHIQSLDFACDDEPRDIPAPGPRPEEGIDREWVSAVVAAGVERLKQSYIAERRPEYFEVFRRFALVDPSEARPTYEDLARELGRSAKDVGNYLTHARQRLRELIREVVAESVSDPQALREELRDLFGGLQETPA